MGSCIDENVLFSIQEKPFIRLKSIRVTAGVGDEKDLEVETQEGILKAGSQQSEA